MLLLAKALETIKNVFVEYSIKKFPFDIRFFFFVFFVFVFKIKKGIEWINFLIWIDEYLYRIYFERNFFYCWFELNYRTGKKPQVHSNFTSDATQFLFQILKAFCYTTHKYLNRIFQIFPPINTLQINLAESAKVRKSEICFDEFQSTLRGFKISIHRFQIKPKQVFKLSEHFDFTGRIRFTLIDYGEELPNIFHGLNFLLICCGLRLNCFWKRKVIAQFISRWGDEKFSRKDADEWSIQLTINVVIKHFEILLLKYLLKFIFLTLEK